MSYLKQNLRSPAKVPVICRTNRIAVITTVAGCTLQVILYPSFPTAQCQILLTLAIPGIGNPPIAVRLTGTSSPGFDQQNDGQQHSYGPFTLTAPIVTATLKGITGKPTYGTLYAQPTQF